MRRLSDVRSAGAKLARMIQKEKRKARKYAEWKADRVRHTWLRIRAAGRDPDPERNVPCAASWADYDRFLADVGRPDDPKLRLCRIFDDLPWIPGNTIWRKPVVRFGHELVRGNPAAECRVAGLTPEQGAALRERLKAPVEMLPTTTPEDWGGRAQKAKDRGLDPRTVAVRISRGWTLDRALSEPAKSH